MICFWMLTSEGTRPFAITGSSLQMSSSSTTHAVMTDGSGSHSSLKMSSYRCEMLVLSSW